MRIANRPYDVCRVYESGTRFFFLLLSPPDITSLNRTTPLIPHPPSPTQFALYRPLCIATPSCLLVWKQSFPACLWTCTPCCPSFVLGYTAEILWRAGVLDSKRKPPLFTFLFLRKWLSSWGDIPLSPNCWSLQYVRFNSEKIYYRCNRTPCLVHSWHKRFSISRIQAVSFRIPLTPFI